MPMMSSARAKVFLPVAEPIHLVPKMPSNQARKPVKLHHAAQCLEIIRQGSRSFHFASLVLPRDIRMAAASLYAFCRVSDDLVDDPRATLEAAHRLRERLALAYDGRPIDHIAARAFAEVVEAYDIPQSVPLSMIEGRAVLRPEIADVVRAAYDPVMPAMAQDASHALRLTARITRPS